MCLQKNIYQECKNGHKFTPENTYITPKGYRQCLACNKANMKRFKEHAPDPQGKLDLN